MKRFLLLAVVLALGALTFAGSESLPYTGSKTFTFTVDTTGDSTRYDSTIYLGPTYGYKSLKGHITLGMAASNFATGAGGVAEDDSVWIWIYSVFANQLTLIDSAVAGASIDTLDFYIPDDVGDTLLGDGLAIKIEAYDSINDTVATATQGYIQWRLNYHLKLK